MGNTFGYMRISTKEADGKQSFKRQEVALSRYEQETGKKFLAVLRDDASGKSFDRPEWQKLEQLAHPGDTIVAKSIDRMTRQAEDGYRKYMELLNRGVRLVFLDSPTLSTDYISAMMEKADSMGFLDKTIREMTVKLLLAVELDRAETERERISKRIREGIAASEKKPGRRTGALDKMTPELRDDLARYLARSLTGTAIMEKHGISRNTMKKYAETLRAEM